MTSSLRASLIALREEMRKKAHGQGAIYASGIVECIDLVDALLAGLPGAGEDNKETDAEWRYRWHRRLGRGGLETEGKFYERIDAILSARSAPPAEGGQRTVRAPWPDPTPEMLADPLFEAVWQRIKTWDINVPEVYAGYMGATGNHVRAIVDVVAATILNHLASAPRAEPPADQEAKQ